jgi:methylenetetrahydrofolate--tRNA-(uracil-5-)-methyltransferase
MNVNFGLLPPVEIKKPEGVKRWRGTDKAMAKREAMSRRALEDIAAWA